MGGSATREPELIYVVREGGHEFMVGGGATYDNNSWRRTSSSARPTVLLPSRLRPSAFSGNPSHRFACWLRYTDQNRGFALCIKTHI